MHKKIANEEGLLEWLKRNIPIMYIERICNSFREEMRPYSAVI